MTAAPGSQDVLGDRYLLEDELGTGGQGTVYRALDRRLGCHVAVKFLRPEVAPLLGADRFQREIAIAASLSHPNIVPLLDSGGEGETLRARLRRQPQLPLDQALAITRDVATAIDYADGHGSSTGTSSRRTSCSPRAAPWSSTSGSPARSRWPVRPPSPRAASSSALRPT